MTKIATDIEQSKILKDILLLESADMGWYYSENPYASRNQMWLGTKVENADLPAWSLSALLQIIPKNIEGLNRLRINIDNVDFSIWYDDLNGYGVNDKLPDITLKEPVDACVEMILMLHKEGLL